VQKDELQQTKLLELYLRLSLEDYVLGVICGELPSQSPNIGAALKAQAIAARTYAVWKIQNAKILRDDSRDQVFVGSDYITENARNAARATAGKVITENQKVVPGFFHRNCGGGTSNAYEADFSKSEIVALSGSQDLDCADVYQRWQHTVSASELDKLCREFKLGDSLTAINTISKDQHLRRLHVRIQGDKGHRDITGEFLRARLSLPSMIWHELMLNRDGSITVTGSGHGHGIGLCQEGAMRNAQQGLNYAAIIQHYYPRAKIETLTAELFNR
jgi:stage II sporulation protein D